jgi:hypothetical protein
MANTAKANSYAKKAEKNSMIKAIKGKMDTKGKIGPTALVTGKDLVIGVLGGGIVAAMCGKASLPIGFLITGAGHYTDNKMIQLVGVCTMASNGFSKTNTTVNGLDGLDGVKERLQAFKGSLSEKFFLDKVIKKKAAATTAGIGEVQYFSYPDTMNGDLAALNDIEQQLAESALQYQQQVEGGVYDDNAGELAEVEERLY